MHPEELLLHLVAGKTKLFLHFLDKSLPRKEGSADLLPSSSSQDVWPQLFDVVRLELPLERRKRGVQRPQGAVDITPEWR
jgi:hypothetical protein